MNNKYKVRRRIEKKEIFDYMEYVEKKNPAWDAKLFKHLYREGREDEYDIEQFLVTEVPVYKIEEIEVLEYEIKCLYCNLKKWMLKRSAKYCSDSCRVMGYRERKKAKKGKKK